MLHQQSRSSRSAFSLVELIVVIGIVGILVSMLLPAVQMVREGARRTTCSNNQRQLLLALHSYESAHESLPQTLSTKEGSFLLFWQASVLPFLEQASVFEEIRRENQNGVHIYSHSNRKSNIPVLQCASDPDQGQLIKPELGTIFAFTDFCGVAGSNGDNGVFRLDIGEVNRNKILFSQVSGGLSNCLIFGERPPSDLGEGFGSWLGGQNSLAASTYTNGTSVDFPTDLLGACGDRTDFGFQNGERGSRCDWTHHWSFHPGGTNFARTDGSLTFLSYEIDKEVLAGLAARD